MGESRLRISYTENGPASPSQINLRRHSSVIGLRSDGEQSQQGEIGKRIGLLKSYGHFEEVVGEHLKKASTKKDLEELEGALKYFADRRRNTWPSDVAAAQLNITLLKKILDKSGPIEVAQFNEPNSNLGAFLDYSMKSPIFESELGEKFLSEFIEAMPKAGRSPYENRLAAIQKRLKK